jgi:hypothetical protein
MRSERQRHNRPERLPRRPTDRIEDLVAWLLATLGLLSAVLAATTGVRLYGEGTDRVSIESRERTQVQAVLLEPAPSGVALAERGRQMRSVPVPVPARYTAPDGTERVADALVQGPLPAGAGVPMWVDRAGEATTAPGHPLDALGSAATGAAGVLILGGVVLGFSAEWSSAGSGSGSAGGSGGSTWPGGNASGDRLSRGGAARAAMRTPGRHRPWAGHPGYAAETK